MLGGHDKVLAAVTLFCLVAGALVSYAQSAGRGPRASGDVGIAERSERLVIGLVAIGLSGLGVPYVLPVGLWLLAVASAFTFGQRVLAVRRAAAEQAAAARARPRAAAPGAARADNEGSEAGSQGSAGGQAVRWPGQCGKHRQCGRGDRSGMRLKEVTGARTEGQAYRCRVRPRLVAGLPPAGTLDRAGLYRRGGHRLAPTGSPAFRSWRATCAG